MPSIELDGADLVLDVGPTLHPSINEWPGWRRRRDGVYRAPLRASSVLPVRSSPGLPITWSPGAAKARDAVLASLHLAREAIRGGTLPIASNHWPTPRRPLRHQHNAIEAARCFNWRCLLADDMGLGKTSTALWCALEAKAARVLIVCPVSVKWNWEKELKLTLGEQWNATVIDGTPTKRADLIAECKNTQQHAIIINYDLLCTLSDEQRKEIGNVDFLILDESHYLKSRKSERTKLVTSMAATISKVMLLTGTPQRNLADDLFPQVEIINPGTWTGYRDFAKRHLVMARIRFGARGVNKVMGAKNLDALAAVMNTLQIKRSKAEVINLPPKVHTFPLLDLDPVTGRIYNAMRDRAKVALSELDPQVTIFEPRARSAVEAAMRCEQIAQGFCGGIPPDLAAKEFEHAEKIPGRPVELIFPHAPKLVWLMEAIEAVRGQGGCPVVFSRFNAPLFWLHHRVPHAVILHGGLASTEKSEAIDAFQLGKFQVMLCQVKMAQGFNLTRSQDVFFLGRDWSPAINLQAEDRCHRMGQKGTVNIQIPLVRNTIEMMVDKKLHAKGVDMEQALRTLTVSELMEAL